jgi:hypothetical protein
LVFRFEHDLYRQAQPNHGLSSRILVPGPQGSLIATQLISFSPFETKLQFPLRPPRVAAIAFGPRNSAR